MKCKRIKVQCVDLPKLKGFLFRSTTIVENDLPLSVLEVVEEESADNRDNFKAEDFDIKSLLASGSTDLMKNPITMHVSPIEQVDNIANGAEVIDAINKLNDVK